MDTQTSGFSGCVRRILRHGLVAVTCVTYPVVALALPEAPPATPEGVMSRQGPAPNEQRRGQRPMRRPPQVAIEACTAKNEGDSCSFNTPDGMRNGECLTGAENVFACRPHRGAPPADNAQRTAPVQQQGAASTESQTKPRNSPRAGGQSDKASEPVKNQPPVHSVTPQPSEAPLPQSPAAPPQPQKHAESTPTDIPQSKPADMYGMLSQYAGHLDSYLAVALIAAGIAWYASYRYSIVPLRRLRKVTQLLAGGNLSARVGEGLIFRKNEVADLGRDVDRMAERIESLVGAHQRLIRDVSHELRSPLARLNVALELARQSAGAGHTAPFDRIERESDRLNELIGQLLMLTKLENESGAVQMAELDITALISEIVQDVDFEARSSDRSVVAAPCSPLLLNGNRELMRQAIENLVRNAVRYTATGTAVELSMRRKETGGRSWAHIEVRDYGPGVPESELYYIFRPFYRVNDARERKSGGTGVGLAISDRAVRLHGGSLRAFNAPGNGLVMELELPLAT